MRNLILFLGLLVLLPAFAEQLYRMDNQPYSKLTADKKGHKSHIDRSNGSLYPANYKGNITVLDHIARSKNRLLKSNSQYTSFSSLDLGSYYGGAYRITLDRTALEAAIQSRRHLGVRIHSTEMIAAAFEAELRKTLKLSPMEEKLFEREKEKLLTRYYAMVRHEKRPAEECDKFFWKGVNGFKAKLPRVFRGMSPADYETYTFVFNGLRHVRTDHEVLIEGIVPKKYFVLEKLGAQTP